MEEKERQTQSSRKQPDFRSFLNKACQFWRDRSSASRTLAEYFQTSLRRRRFRYSSFLDRSWVSKDALLSSHHSLSFADSYTHCRASRSTRPSPLQLAALPVSSFHPPTSSHVGTSSRRPFPLEQPGREPALPLLFLPQPPSTLEEAPPIRHFLSPRLLPLRLESPIRPHSPLHQAPPARLCKTRVRQCRSSWSGGDGNGSGSEERCGDGGGSVERRGA